MAARHQRSARAGWPDLRGCGSERRHLQHARGDYALLHQGRHSLPPSAGSGDRSAGTRMPQRDHRRGQSDREADALDRRVHPRSRRRHGAGRGGFPASRRSSSRPRTRCIVSSGLKERLVLLEPSRRTPRSTDEGTHDAARGSTTRRVRPDFRRRNSAGVSSRASTIRRSSQ